LVIMAMVYAVGHISGAHFNGAVTFAFALTRHFPWPRAVAYWGAQIVGALAAAALLREELPELNVRVINVVDLMRLQDEREHPHGLSDAQFDALFTPDKPVIFAYHGYPWLIHRLTYRRTNHRNLHVRGYKEEGTTTTPFDMVMLNDLDRFHLVIDVIDRVPGLATQAAPLRQRMVDERLRHRAYTRQQGDDPPEISGWTWPA
jgi:xylulose-5-phosphate/fructose-6-phosphate phosphoketolase